MLLSELKVGQAARIIAVSGGKKLRQKLALRGITEGSNLRIISAQGPITLKINSNTTTLGRGMADKIRVRRLNTNQR
ncbi:ferrous iron transport protein A [Candidatus Bipolaricaulota bacterium]|nr:ferrous iron transport protein A [Candidatus Bipolaricaulota bacterium]